MGYFVTVTFDLNYASNSPHGTNVYAKITEALEEVDYSKVVTGRRNRPTGLPSNTYVAEFEDDADDKEELIELVKLELKSIFSRYSVNGKYFISVGRDWGWNIGTFKSQK